MCVDANPVAALGFGTVQLQVSAIRPDRGGGANPFGREGAANADSDLQLCAAYQWDAQRFNGFANSICHDLAKGDVARRQNDSEFLTAITCHSVHGSHTIRQASGNHLQDLVAGQMAMRVIDFLEMVDVQHEQQRWLARSGNCFNFKAQHVTEMTSVGQAGQGVFQG